VNNENHGRNSFAWLSKDEQEVWCIYSARHEHYNSTISCESLVMFLFLHSDMKCCIFCLGKILICHFVYILLYRL
jgi:hypothetical protein